MKKMSIVIIVLIAIIIPFINGCATILKGSNETVDINSDPNGAKVYVNGQMLGKTPLQVKLSAKNTHYIEFVKEGYEKKTYILSSSVGGEWIILDILLGVLPLIIDAATGSWYNFDNNYSGVYLEKNIKVSDSLNDTEIFVPSLSEDKSPLFLSIKLTNNNEEIIFDGKVSLIYKSLWEKSLLSAKGVWAFPII